MNLPIRLRDTLSSGSNARRRGRGQHWNCWPKIRGVGGKSIALSDRRAGVYSQPLFLMSRRRILVALILQDHRGQLVSPPPPEFLG